MSEAKTPPSDAARPEEFGAVLNAELTLIAQQRQGDGTIDDKTPASAYDRAREMKLAGLALSGGGIRSATFNLGFLQGLANRRALHGFDYLSTVSGGGYVGAWLSALLHRRYQGQPVGEAEVRELAARELTTPPGDTGPLNSGFVAPESAPVRFVRRYADYLTPQLGLSSDSLALLSLGLRNMVVMQMLLVSLLITLYSVLLLLAGTAWISPNSAFNWLVERYLGASSASWRLAPGSLLLVLALVAAICSQGIQRQPPAPDAAPAPAEKRGRARLRRMVEPSPNLFIATCVLLPALLSGVLLATALESAAQADAPIARGGWIAIPVLGYALAWSKTLSQRRAWLGMLGGASVLGAALWAGTAPLSALLKDAPFGHTVAFAPIVALGLHSFVITVHMALADEAISEQNREWWARAGGQGIFLALAWTLAFGFLLYVPPLLAYSVEAATAGGVLWSALTWIGARLAQGAGTGTKAAIPWQDGLAKLAPWVFVVGLLAVVAWGYVGVLIRPEYDDLCAAAMIDAYHAALAATKTDVLCWTAAGAGLMFLALLRWVDLNIFSAHSFYRNRLARTFLGATRNAEDAEQPRRPNPYTGFDPADDLPLCQLGEQRPIPLLNANVNLTGGDELAWQTRRGASFVFAPHYCGFSMHSTGGVSLGGYRATARYGGGELSLATAAAVSGAAASPNMGFHTSVSVAALLTILNLRLARWCPNPNQGQWQAATPRWGAGYLFAELLGEANGRKSWINLSDGGHFDNLGIYELVRRRAALILVSDLGADQLCQFDDLAMLMRKLRSDFGVELEIEEAALAAIRPAPGVAAPGGAIDRSVLSVRPELVEGQPRRGMCGSTGSPRTDNSQHVQLHPAPGAPGFSRRHWAFGRIRYPDGPDGYLIYVKSSLTRDLPLDIGQYRATHPTFPHEATSDQWFDEDQFEAYRHLGQIIAERLFELLLPEHKTPGETLPARQLVERLVARVETALASPAADPAQP